jgi:hypothetical protein
MSEQPFAPKPGPRAPVPGSAVPGSAVPGPAVPGPAVPGRAMPGPPGPAAPAPGPATHPAPRPAAPDGEAEDVDDGRPRVDPSAGMSSDDAAVLGRDEAVKGQEPEPEPTQARASDREPTGDAAVDQALDLLDSLSGESLDRHIEVGQQVHRTLQARLADIGRE